MSLSDLTYEQRRLLEGFDPALKELGFATILQEIITAVNANTAGTGLADGAVTADAIGTGAVTETKIGTGAVTNTKIGADAVDGTKVADDAIDSEHIADGAVDNAHLADDTIRQGKLDRAFTFEEFQSQPVCIGKAGAALTGATGEVGAMAFPENVFEYHIKGAGQTILGPVRIAGGIDVGLDQTDDEGLEITQGILADDKHAFVVGTSPAFYAKCKFSIQTVAGTDDCAFGFRKAEAYQANIDDYDEMACLNVISGDITVETILNGTATVTTDTTDNWADGETHTLEVYVDAAGAVTYQIDGAAPTATAAFSFDAAEVVVPFFFMLNANASQAGQVIIQEWEVGLQ